MGKEINNFNVRLAEWRNRKPFISNKLSLRHFRETLVKLGGMQKKPPLRQWRLNVATYRSGLEVVLDGNGALGFERELCLWVVEQVVERHLAEVYSHRPIGCDFIVETTDLKPYVESRLAMFLAQHIDNAVIEFQTDAGVVANIFGRVEPIAIRSGEFVVGQVGCDTQPRIALNRDVVRNKNTELGGDIESRSVFLDGGA